MKTGWKVCRYLGTCNGKELAGDPIWDFIFPTRKDAQSYWYDSAPGRNDRCTYVKVKGDPIDCSYRAEDEHNYRVTHTAKNGY